MNVRIWPKLDLGFRPLAALPPRIPTPFRSGSRSEATVFHQPEQVLKFGLSAISCSHLSRPEAGCGCRPG